MLVLAAAVAIVASWSNAAVALSAVFVNPGKRGEVFWDMVSRTMTVASTQLGIELEILYAERNVRAMQALGFEVAARSVRPDFLILVNEEAAARPIMERASTAGIKVLLLSNTLTGDDAILAGPPRAGIANWIGSIIPDMEAAGARMAEALIADARKRGRTGPDGRLHIFALAGDETTPTSIARNEGFRRTIAKHDDVVVDRFLVANWNRTDATRLTETYLAWAKRRGIQVAGIWAANDAMALGAMEAVDTASLLPGQDVAIVGLNWSADAVRHVEEGRMLLTDGGHFLAGAWSMVMVSDYTEGCDFGRADPVVRFATSAVTGENVAAVRDLILRQAFHTVDFRSFKARKGDACGDYDFSMRALRDALNPLPSASQ
jgi:ABC-type sugar transport system substrate-binding protein